MIFLDTSAIVALSNRLDERHAEARALFPAVSAMGELLTHNYVLVETFSLLHRRHGLRVALHFEEASNAFDVVWVDAELHEQATTALLAANQRHISLVDWTSFAVMRRRAIDEAFAFDDDFAQRGFEPFVGL